MDIQLRRVQRALADEPGNPDLLRRYYFQLTRIYGLSMVDAIISRMVRNTLSAARNAYITYYNLQDDVNPVEPYETIVRIDIDALYPTIDVYDNVEGQFAYEMYDGTEEPSSVIETTIGNLAEYNTYIRDMLEQQPWFCGFTVEQEPPKPLWVVTKITPHYEFMQPQITQEEDWYRIDYGVGQDIVPADVVSFRNVTVEDIVESSTSDSVTQDYINEHIYYAEIYDSLEEPIEYHERESLPDEDYERFEELCQEADLSHAVYDYEGIDEIQQIQGYGARLSAPGYTDATPWAVYDSHNEAAQHLLEMYPPDALPIELVMDFKLEVCSRLLDYVYAELQSLES